MVEDDLRLWIVICDFNGWSQTRQCLHALSKSKCKKANVVLVDHGTQADTQEGVSREFPAVTLIKGSSELWWAGATNLGIKSALSAGATHIMLLNNDCYVEATTIERLIAHVKNEPTAIIAPVQIDNENGNCISVKRNTCLLFGFTIFGSQKSLTDRQKREGIITTRHIGGGRGVIISRAVLEVVGLLDEKHLPHYGADHDFYFRCRQRGIPLRIATDSAVRVDHARTSVADQQYRLGLQGFRIALQSPRSHRNLSHQIALYRKHYPIPGLYWMGIGLFLGRFATVFFIRSILARSLPARKSRV